VDIGTAEQVDLKAPEGETSEATGPQVEAAPISAIWDQVPVAVSLVTSAVFIIRSVMTIGGKRTYSLFDDAAISLTYARNLATGHGLVWMAGQHPVEGYSNFLWTLWMAAIEWMGPSDNMAGFWVMVSGAVLLAANTYVICRITRRLAPRSHLVPLLAGLAVSLYYGLDSWTLEGMETGLVAFLYSAGILCAIRACDADASRSVRTRMLVGTAIMMSLAVLTRDDALIMAVLVAVFVYLRAPRRLHDATIVFAPVLVVMAGHIAFRLVYYGYPFPNTYYLKTAGIPLSTRVGRGWVVVAQNFTMQLVVAVLLTAGYFLLVRRAGGRAATGTGLLASAFIAQIAYLVYVGGDSYDGAFSDRYLAVMVPFLFVLAVLGAHQLAALGSESGLPLIICGCLIVGAGVIVDSAVLPTIRLQMFGFVPWHSTSWSVLLWVFGWIFILLGSTARKWAVAAGFVISVLVAGLVVTTNGVQAASWSRDDYFGFSFAHQLDAIGLEVANATRPGTTIALTGAGNTAYFDHRPSIDLLGYSDHVVAVSEPHTSVFVPGWGWLPLLFQPGHDKWDYQHSIHDLRPDVVLGLSHPSPTDVADMVGWGYLKTGNGIYYLPGKLDVPKL